MTQKLPVDGFKWKKNMLKFDEEFIKNYDKDSDKGYIFKVDIEYLKTLQKSHSDLPLLSERMKVNKCSKLVCNLYDKELCCSYKNIRASIKPRTNIKESS